MPIARIYKKVKRLLKRHPFFHFFRCFLITREPDAKLFSSHAINDYNSTKSIPKIFWDEYAKIAITSKNSFEKALAIAKFMKQNYKGGRGLGYSSKETLTIMKSNNGGVCSDFSQVFINFCIISKIRVREWSVSEKLYGNFGHVFNEIYCEEFKKWVFIDSGKVVYLMNKQNKEPLSTIEYIDLMTADQSDIISIVNFYTNKEEEDIEKLSLLHRIYFNKNNIFFLISNYRIRLFDTALKLRKYSPLPLLHFILICFGGYYKYHFYINKENFKSTRAELSKIGRKNYGSKFIKQYLSFDRYKYQTLSNFTLFAFLGLL